MGHDVTQEGLRASFAFTATGRDPMTAKRTEGLLTQVVNGELLIMRPATNEAHALNETAAIVFELCDGRTSRTTIAEEVARRGGLPRDEDIVALALTELEDAGLVTVDETE